MSHLQNSDGDASTIDFPMDYIDTNDVASIGTEGLWTRKPPCDWTPNDVSCWMYETVAVEQEFSCGCWDVRHVCGENWQDVDGPTLCWMSIDEFKERDQRHGHLLFERLHERPINEPYDLRLNDSILSLDAACVDAILPQLTCHHNCTCRLPGIESMLPPSPNTNNVSPNSQLVQEQPNDDDFLFLYSFDEISDFSSSALATRSPTADSPTTAPPSAHRYRKSSIDSTPADSASCSGDSVNEMDENEVTRKVIKDRKTKVNAIHLWQFMLALLADSRCNPDLIKWLDQSDGVFRIVRSAEIARLWGIKKKNKKMTFEKMSRALRWCRDNLFLADVPKNRGYPKKLCFRFGTRAKNWNGLSSTPISEIIGVSGVPLD